MEKLLSVEEARNRILSRFSSNASVSSSLLAAQGKVLAEDMFAVLDLPPFANSSMDGFALRAEDVQNAREDQPVELQVIENIPAGVTPRKFLTVGTTSRIMTGAPMPAGATAVVPVEFTNFSDRYNEQKLPDRILVKKAVDDGDYVRPTGQDIRAGQKIFNKGSILRPQDLGVLAAQGIDQVNIIRTPKVAMLSSGDELEKPGIPLKSGKIYDSNTTTIQSLIQSFGAEVINLGVVRDRMAAIKTKLAKIPSLDVDLIVSTAGVSVGVYDLIRDAILEDGNLNFWKVNMKPGKPLTFGEFHQVPFLGLPGNPVSAYVSALIFIKPVIQKLLGLNTAMEFFPCILEEDVFSDGRESYLRVIIEQKEGVYKAKLAQHQGSGNLFSLVCANALLIIPAGVKSLATGEKTKFFWI